jgi:hypothetical protein
MRVPQRKDCGAVRVIPRVVTPVSSHKEAQNRQKKISFALCVVSFFLWLKGHCTCRPADRDRRACLAAHGPFLKGTAVLDRIPSMYL